jgi:hypothetical protein
MQIVHNSILFGERCKGLNINENFVTHILSLNIDTSDTFLYSLVLFFMGI